MYKYKYLLIILIIIFYTSCSVATEKMFRSKINDIINPNLNISNWSFNEIKLENDRNTSLFTYYIKSHDDFYLSDSEFQEIENTIKIFYPNDSIEIIRRILLINIPLDFNIKDFDTQHADVIHNYREKVGGIEKTIDTLSGWGINSDKHEGNYSFLHFEVEEIGDYDDQIETLRKIFSDLLNDLEINSLQN